MSVNSVGAYAAQTAAAAAAVSAASNGSNASASVGGLPQLTQSDFLQLITAQMQNQDPTQPTNPNQFINEFASLSEVSGINGMETSMSNVSNSLLSSQVLSGTNLIGHEVLASGTTAALASGGTVTGAVDVPSGVSAMMVQVTDSNGQLVRSFSVTPQQGMTNFTWDGKTDTGAAAPAGTYGFSVTADENGAAASLSPLLQQKVNSVTIDPTTNTLSLNTDAGTLPLSAVQQVM